MVAVVYYLFGLMGLVSVFACVVGYGADADAVVGGACCFAVVGSGIGVDFVVCCLLWCCWFCLVSLVVGVYLLLVCIVLFAWYLIVVVGLVNSVVYPCSWCGFVAAFLGLLW